MYTVNLENNTRFEAGRVYYYHFSCNYDSLSFMQIVSVSDTRKTAIIQELIGGEPYGEPKRKKIYVSGGVEHISAGNYSMAGGGLPTRGTSPSSAKTLTLISCTSTSVPTFWNLCPNFPPLLLRARFILLMFISAKIIISMAKSSAGYLLPIW